MRRKSKPPKPVKLAKQQLADLRRRLEKIDADRKAQAPKKKRGRPPKPKPAIETKPQPKERKMPRHRKSDTGEDIVVTDSLAVEEPTKVYPFHLNLVTPAVEAVPPTETEPEKPAIPEIIEQQAEGVRWSDRTYTIHWTALGPVRGYLTYTSLRELTDTYPKLTLVFVDGVEPKDEEEAEVEARTKEAEDAAIKAKEARAAAEEAKARMEARQHEHA